jgi:hypothetical protein
MENNTEEQFQLFAAVSPAKTCQLPGARKALKPHAPAYGPSCAELLARYDPNTQSWKTSQHSLVETEGDGFSEYSETWPRSGMTRSGIAYQLPRLAPTITEIGSGLFATPNTPDGMPPKSEKAIKREMEVTRKGRSQPANLRDQVTQQYWPTPTAHNGKEFACPSEYRRNTPTLSAQAGGALNPAWVEWLMGFPEGWTDLKD